MMALQKKPKGGELRTDEKMRNKRISSKRDSKQRPYAVIKNVFKSGHTRLTTSKEIR
jgi:IS5 family transposase